MMFCAYDRKIPNYDNGGCNDIKSWQVYLLQSEAAKDLLSFIREYFRHEAVSSTDNIKDDNKTI